MDQPTQNCLIHFLLLDIKFLLIVNILLYDLARDERLKRTTSNAQVSMLWCDPLFIKRLSV